MPRLERRGRRGDRHLCARLHPVRDPGRARAVRLARLGRCPDDAHVGRDPGAQHRQPARAARARQGRAHGAREEEDGSLREHARHAPRARAVAERRARHAGG